MPVTSPDGVIGRELYDHRGDPGELDWAGEHVNVVEAPEHADLVAALHAQHRRFTVTANAPKRSGGIEITSTDGGAHPRAGCRTTRVQRGARQSGQRRPAARDLLEPGIFLSPGSS